MEEALVATWREQQARSEETPVVDIRSAPPRQPSRDVPESSVRSPFAQPLPLGSGLPKTHAERNSASGGNDREQEGTLPKYASPDEIEQPEGCPQVAMSERERERRRQFVNWVDVDDSPFA